MVNSELFRQIADRIERNPSEYNQDRWRRDFQGDAACIFCIAQEILGLIIGDEDATIKEMGLGRKDALKLWHWTWKPKPEYTVPQALRLIADGKSVAEVSA